MIYRTIGDLRLFRLPELGLTVVLWALISGIMHPAAAAGSLRADTLQVGEWNRFVDRLLAAHNSFLGSHQIRTQEEIGGYAGQPEFYREVSYFDSRTDRLLSRIRWEMERPDAIHVIEILFYDEKGRVERDYSAAYLPKYRNAPYQTLVNLHRYTGALHAFRQVAHGSPRTGSFRVIRADNKKYFHDFFPGSKLNKRRADPAQQKRF